MKVESPLTLPWIKGPRCLVPAGDVKEDNGL